MKKIIFWLAIIALLIPILPLEIGDISVVLPKTAFFQMVVEVMFVVWVWLALRDPSVRPNWKHPVIATGGIFLLICYALLPFALDPSLSFWSTMDRMMGLVNMTHLYVWLLIMSSVFRSWDDWKPLFKIAWWTGVVVSLIGLLEFVSQTADARISSTFGNPGYLMAYLVPTLFLTFLLWNHEQSKTLRRVYFSGLIPLVIAIILTASRSGILALLVGAMILIVGWIVTSPNRIRNKKLLISFISIISLSALFLFFLRTSLSDWGHANLPYILSRLIYTDFGGDRLAFWKIALDGFQQRPLIGWGFEQYGAIFDRSVDFAGKDSAILEPWFDRTHNQFLEILIGTGIFGFLAYLSYWGALFWSTIRLRGKEAVVLLSVFVSSIVVLFFSFDTLEAMMIMSMTAAYLIASTNLFPERPRHGGGVEGSSLGLRQAQTIVTFLIVLLLPFSYSTNIKPILAISQVNQAYIATKTNRTEGLVLLKQALSNDSFVDQDAEQFLFSIVSVLTQPLMLNDESMMNMTQYLSEKINESVIEHPNDYRLLVQAAELNRLAGNTEQAKKNVQSALEISVLRPEAYREQAEIHLLSNQFDEAISLFQKALSLSPQHRDIMAGLQLRLSYTSALSGDMDRAFMYLDQAIVSQYEVRQDLRLSVAYAQGCVRSICVTRALEFANEQSSIFPNQVLLQKAVDTLRRLSESGLDNNSVDKNIQSSTSVDIQEKSEGNFERN